MNVGELIKKERVARGITQKELADGLCCIDYIYKLENGKRSPSIYLLYELSMKLDVDLYTMYFNVYKQRDI